MRDRTLVFHNPPCFRGLLALDRVNRENTVTYRRLPWIALRFRGFDLSFTEAALRQELENAGD